MKIVKIFAALILLFAVVRCTTENSFEAETENAKFSNWGGSELPQDYVPSEDENGAKFFGDRETINETDSYVPHDNSSSDRPDITTVDVYTLTDDTPGSETDGQISFKFADNNGAVWSGALDNLYHDDFERDQLDKFTIHLDHQIDSLDDLVSFKLHNNSTDGWRVKAIVIVINKEVAAYYSLNFNQYIDMDTQSSIEVPFVLPSPSGITTRTRIDSMFFMTSTGHYSSTFQPFNNTYISFIPNTRLLPLNYPEPGFLPFHHDVFKVAWNNHYVNDIRQLKVYNYENLPRAFELDTFIMFINGYLVYYRDDINHPVHTGSTWSDPFFRHNYQWDFHFGGETPY